MGSTNSIPALDSVGHDLAQTNYKLLRRFTCPCYGSVTIVQTKSTKTLVALKELITDEAVAQYVVKRRTQLIHPGLANVLQCRAGVQESLCSNIRKVQLAYEYYGTTLEDYRANNIPTDQQVCSIGDQLFDVLNFIDSNGISHTLLNSNTVVVANLQVPLVKIVQTEQSLLTADFGKRVSRDSYWRYVPTKRMYLLHPLIARNSLLCGIQLSAAKARLQNVFCVALIMIEMVEGKNIYEMDLFNQSGFCLKKLRLAVKQLTESYPMVVQKVLRLLNLVKHSLRNGQGCFKYSHIEQEVAPAKIVLKNILVSRTRTHREVLSERQQ